MVYTAASRDPHWLTQYSRELLSDMMMQLKEALRSASTVHWYLRSRRAVNVAAAFISFAIGHAAEIASHGEWR